MAGRTVREPAFQAGLQRLGIPAALFSLKCFAAAMLAYYLALRIGLDRPFWAVVTSYIVAQPLSGAVRSKALFRLGGTVLGGAAAVVLVPNLVNEPALLSLALAAWLGLCIYLSQLDRTPRAYVFLLAGYTASIIGIPSVGAPGRIFEVAILRVQEIGLGILCASLVHGLVFPRSVTERLLARLDAIMADAARWTAASLASTPPPSLPAERQRIVLDLAELHQLSIHLPFDTARLRPRVRTLRALQDQLSMLLPLASAVEDRLGELAATAGGVPPAVEELVATVASWLERIDAAPDREAQADALIARTRSLEPAQASAAMWHDMLLLSLLSRLGEMVAAVRDAYALVDQIRAPDARPTPRVAGLIGATGRRPFHIDRWVAARSAMAAAAAILLGCLFWIETAWPDGAGAVLMAGITCAIYGSLDRPAPAIRTMQLGSTAGLALAILYDFTVLPRVTDFVTLAAAVAPGLLLMGGLMGTPQTSSFGMGMVMGLPQTIGFAATYRADFAGALNAALAQFIGIAFAGAMVGLFQSSGAEQGLARLARAGWRDVARRARGQDADSRRWLARMLDRIGLMIPRIAARGDKAGTPLLDALVTLRTGFVAGELHRLAKGAEPGQAASAGQVLVALERHFDELDPARPQTPPATLLAAIDGAAQAFATSERRERREALVLLTSLRRNLFPAAPALGAGAAA